MTDSEEAPAASAAPAFRPFTLLIALLAISGVAVFGVSRFARLHPRAEADNNHNVNGWAWSDNIGWISFNCTDVSCTSSNYGVSADIVTGELSGYAWSDNIGWIHFAPSSGFPEGPNHGARIDVVTGVVSGWARAVAHGNGWDGWIKLSGSWTNGVRVDLATGQFSGFGWGSDVVGWVDFRPAFGGVQLSGSLNLPPNTVDDYLATNEGETASLPVLANDSDPEGGVLALSDVTQPANGTVSIVGVTVEYTPNPGFTGTDSFSYTAQDPQGSTGTATVTITVFDCGNGIREGNEQCDGGDLNGASCTTEGYFGGTISCNAACRLDVDQCVEAEDIIFREI